MLLRLALSSALLFAPLNVEKRRAAAKVQLDLGEPEAALELLQALFAELPADGLDARVQVAAEMAKARVAVHDVSGDTSQLERALSSLRRVRDDLPADDLRRGGLDQLVQSIEAKLAGSGAPSPAAMPQPAQAVQTRQAVAPPSETTTELETTMKTATAAALPDFERTSLEQERDRHAKRAKGQFAQGGAMLGIGGIALVLMSWSFLRFRAANLADDAFDCDNSDDDACKKIKKDQNTFLATSIVFPIVAAVMTAGGISFMVKGGRASGLKRKVDRQLNEGVAILPYFSPRGIGVTGRF